MSTVVVGSYQGSTGGLGSAVAIQVRNPLTGVVLVSRTNVGVREDITLSGRYIWEGTVTTDLDYYDLTWDEGDGVYRGEIFTPRSIGGGATPLPVVGDANGALAGATFLIKRGDTFPYLRRQLVDTNGAVVAIASNDTVKFTMRASTDVAMAGSAKVHASAVIIDAATGIVEYRWATGDTDTTTYVESSTLGRFTDTPYAAEFELTRLADGKIETFPQAGYIAVSIPPDLDPGVEP